MKHRDQLLVLAVLGLTAAAGFVTQGRGSNWPAVLAAGLTLLALCLSLVAWARWLALGPASVRARALLLNGAASLLAATLWFEFVLSIQAAIDSPLRWLLSLALAWMLSPFAAVALTRLGRRLEKW